MSKAGLMDRDPEQVLDEYLVVLAQTGSALAFSRLVVRWTPRLRRHAARLLARPDGAEDAVQDAWLAIARNLRRLRDPARFPAWALAITSRRCIDLIRRVQRDRRLAGGLSSEADSLAPLPTGAPDQQLDLTAAIARLPADQRLMVSLFYGEDLSVEAIAQAHNLPVGTIKSRLHAARQTLKLHMEGQDHDPSR
ncbi:MAG: sigma-70 family RNA polymerase sigma factor [Caulobacter sp.]|nr:sigma-70 family RNA polymerase sigma factor [Caulobacter sp.]